MPVAVLYFIATEGTRIIKPDIPYSSNYSDQFSNVSIWPVVHPKIMSNWFGSINEID